MTDVGGHVTTFGRVLAVHTELTYDGEVPWSRLTLEGKTRVYPLVYTTHTAGLHTNPPNSRTASGSKNPVK